MADKFNPDKLFEKVYNALLPIWGPWYAIFYLTRMYWREIFRREE